MMTDEAPVQYAEIYDGVVHYLHDAPPAYASAVTVVQIPPEQGVQIGWNYDAGTESFSAPPPPPILVPEVLSRRQFFQQLADDGDISQDEALAAVTVGTPPAKINAAIKALPTAQQFPIRMLVSGAADFLRSNPTTVSLGAALGKDAAGLDALWIAAAQL